MRILEPCDERRLLRAELAAEAAVAAHTVLVAAADVARYRGDVPAELLEPAAHDRVARRRGVVFGADADTIGDGFEAARELLRCERPAPLVAHGRRRGKGRRPVERRR